MTNTRRTMALTGLAALLAATGWAWRADAARRNCRSTRAGIATSCGFVGGVKAAKGKAMLQRGKVGAQAGKSPTLRIYDYAQGFKGKRKQTARRYVAERGFHLHDSTKGIAAKSRTPPRVKAGSKYAKRGRVTSPSEGNYDVERAVRGGKVRSRVEKSDGPR